MSRFLIITHSRSGSTLLCRSLDRHPNLNVYVESLHPVDPGVLAWRQHYIQEIYQTDCLNVIWEDEFTRLSDEYDLAPLVDRIFLDYHGFKILLQQLPLNYSIWRHFAQQPLKIIYLQRNNLLEAALSTKLAKRTKTWQVPPDSNGIVDSPIEIAPDFLERYFNHVEMSMHAVKKLFSSHQQIHISYEDMCSNWRPTMDKVQNFLKVPQVPLPITTGKRTTSNPSQIISNYKELARYFSQTKWRKFFEIPLL